MGKCCAGSPVIPYHSAGKNPNSGIDDINDMNALWCHVDNSSWGAWRRCLDDAHSTTPFALCSDLSELASGKKGRASRNITAGLKKAVGLAAMVALVHIML